MPPGSTAIIPVQAVRVSDREVLEFAKAAVASKAYGNIKDLAQAVTKIQVGLEVGLSPALSLSQVYMVGSVPSFSAQFIAAQIKRSRPRYDYRVKELTKEKCLLEFWQDGEVSGPYEFTIKDAEAANLLRNETWKKYPKSLLFARCVTAGARVYCPDVLGGATCYTPEELGSSPAPSDIIDADIEEGD